MDSFVRSRGISSESRPVHCIHFRFVGPSSVPLPVTLTLGEIARLAAMAHYGRATHGGMSPALSGKDVSGRALTSRHVHAHYLPFDEDNDGWIDHLVLWVPGGLTRLEAAACLMIDELRDHSPPTHAGTFAPVQLELEGMGRNAEEVLSTELVGPARVWCSTTPFVLPRHPKWRGVREQRKLVDGPAEQLVRELEHRGLRTKLAQIEQQPDDQALAHGYPLSCFRVRRHDKPTPSPAFRFGFRITFTEPVEGPLALGYGAHFGLGLFLPVSVE